MTCENELAAFETANQAALDAYAAETAAAEAVDVAATAVADAQAALDAATASLGTAQADLVAANGTADNASVAAGQAYSDYLDCKRGNDEPAPEVPENAFFRMPRTRTKSLV